MPMLLSSAIFSSGTFRSCSAWKALAAMVGRMDLRSSRSGFGFFMDDPAYYWMSRRLPKSSSGAGCRASMERAIKVENAPSRVKIVLFKDNQPNLPGKPRRALAATDIELGSHSQAVFDPMD